MADGAMMLPRPRLDDRGQWWRAFPGYADLRVVARQIWEATYETPPRIGWVGHITRAATFPELMRRVRMRQATALRRAMELGQDGENGFWWDQTGNGKAT